MKIDKLYKKVAKFFDNNLKEEKRKQDLLLAMEEKIISMKEKIKNTKDVTKKDEIKKEVEALMKIKSTIVDV